MQSRLNFRPGHRHVSTACPPLAAKPTWRRIYEYTPFSMSTRPSRKPDVRAAFMVFNRESVRIITTYRNAGAGPKFRELAAARWAVHKLPNW
jgi:hypothetical protein